MKEEETLYFDFSNRDPKQWEWIVALMSPMAEERVTMETIFVALDWFDFLCSDLGLTTCDKILRNHLCFSGFTFSFPPKTEKEITSTDLDKAMTYLGNVIKYNLKESKSVCFQHIRHALLNHVASFTKFSLKTVTSVVKESVECRSQFLGPLKTHLPSSIFEDNFSRVIFFMR